MQEKIKQHPNSLKTVVAHLEEDLDLAMHPETLKRFLKKWLSLLSRQNVAQLKASGCRASRQRSSLEQIMEFYHCGLIDLYFGDESTFSMNPKLPYGWSPRGERIRIFPMKDKKINLFGAFRADNFAVTYESQEN